MKLARALEVVRYQRRALGKSAVHCSEPMCAVCALLAIAGELEYQWDTRQGPKKRATRPRSSRGFCDCGIKLVDGLCSNCNG